MRLLVVEDHQKLASLMKKLLSDSGFFVDVVPNAQKAMSALDSAAYDLIVLDLSLPDKDGSEILCSLRRRGQSTPILIATAQADVVRRVQLLNLGADDYIVKPFSLDELLARVRALLRRPKQIASSVVRFGNLTLDWEAMTAQVNNQAIELSRREFAVLANLLRANGTLVPKQKLEEAIYSLDSAVTPNAIEAAVSRLRKRLETHGASVNIVAMRGLGYILRENERACA